MLVQLALACETPFLRDFIAASYWKPLSVEAIQTNCLPPLDFPRNEIYYRRLQEMREGDALDCLKILRRSVALQDMEVENKRCAVTSQPTEMKQFRKMLEKFQRPRNGFQLTGRNVYAARKAIQIELPTSTCS